MIAGSVVAPAPPGRLGVPLDPGEGLRFLTALGEWRDARKAELDELDQAALTATDGQQVVGDIALSMALWKAVSDRYEQLRARWDSGRVGPAELERLSALIWGRLDTTLDASLLARSSAHRGGRPEDATNTGLAVSLPEACRLSDALAGQLRVRLGLELSGLEVTARLRELRAQLERIREQVNLEPPGARQQQAAEHQSRLARRLREATDKAERGGDVGGLLAPLEIEATTFERDLIVGNAQRREAGAKVAAARRQRAALLAQEVDLRELVERCVATVDPAPRLAVPDVTALGPVPNTLAALEAYLARLQLVAKAMAVAERTYREALDEHAELASRLAAYRAKATALRVAKLPEVERAYALAAEALRRQPTSMPVAKQLVALYQTYLQTVSPPPKAAT